MKLITKYLIIVCLAVVVGVLLVLPACTEYDNPAPLVEEYTIFKDTSVHRKVLMIVMEGTVGKELQTLAPPTISNVLLPHSKYTFAGLSDLNTNDATTWASMMSGVNELKHLIDDDSFQPKTNIDNAQTSLPFYPTIFYNIRNTKSTIKTAAVSPWEKLNEGYLSHAHKRVTTSGDERVKDSVIQILNTGEHDFVLASFRDVLDAGVAGNFSAGNPLYSTAMERVDGYIGEVMEVIDERNNNHKEDWLVIVTSNHGGSGNTYGGTSDKERNTFALFYHPKYEQLELLGKKILTPRFNMDMSASVVDTSGIYEISDTPMTIQAFLKIHQDVDGDYDFGGYWRVFGKGSWTVHTQSGGVVLRTDYEGGGIQRGDVGGGFKDGKWHSLTIVLGTNASGTSRSMKAFYDGGLVIPLAEGSNFIASNPDLNPIRIGDSESHFSISEIRIWNKVLTDFQVATYACKDIISTDDPEYANLIGYWRTEAGGMTIENEIKGMPPMVIDSTVYNRSVNNIPCDDGGANVAIENFSIVPQVYYWLDVNINNSWGLDGEVFLSNYALELVR